MSDDLPVHELIANSRNGDRVALQELLVLNFKSLTKHIAQRIPAAIQGEIDADDVIQQTFVQVVRDIKSCRAETEQSFYAWLKTIAEHRLQDAIRHVEAEKRGGDRKRICKAVSPFESSVIDVVEILSAGSHRPSGSAIRHEAIAAVHEAIEALPTEYRRAVQLRLLEGKSLEETASIMNRTPRAVQGFVDRAKKKMHTSLGRLSLYE